MDLCNLERKFFERSIYLDVQILEAVKYLLTNCSDAGCEYRFFGQRANVGNSVGLAVQKIMILQKDLAPRVFPLLVTASSSRRIGDSNSCPPDLELGSLTKWLASWESRQASLHCSLQYCFGTAHGLGSVEKYCLPWRWASESARQVSTPMTCQAVSITQPDRLT